MDSLKTFIKKTSPFRKITFSFLMVIVLGSLFLALPAAKRSPGGTYLDALFTASSAVCVTGLVVHNTATYWTIFGKTVILVLIQIGGLGVITVVIAGSIVSHKRIGLRQRNLMQSAVNFPQLGGIIRFTRFLLLLTLCLETAGAILLSIVFIPQYGVFSGLYKAVFHSISAFCNAGFDLLGDPAAFSSLTAYRGNTLINVVIMFLIISGGLGFLSWADMIGTRFRWRRIRMQTKIILLVSLILIVLPAFFFFMLDFHGFSLKERILMSLFQSVTTRTAGFNTADLSGMSEASRLLIIILMLTGGSPGSTAGGLKTTTFAITVLACVNFLKQKKNVTAFNRTIPGHVIMEAFTLLMFYLTLLLSGSLLMSTFESLPVLDCMFECASALGTVGLTTGITPSLGSFSRIMLILFMYFGRVGGLTLAYSMLVGTKADPGKYPEETIMVG